MDARSLKWLGKNVHVAHQKCVIWCQNGACDMQFLLGLQSKGPPQRHYTSRKTQEETSQED